MYAEFSRCEQASPWGEKGLGLGLSICDRLARLMNHTLTFTSCLGRGSAFGVRLTRDLKARRVRRSEPHRLAADPTGLRGLRVLCVDNDCSILDGMEALLGQWGIQVLKARNSAEATQLCDQMDIDTILADYHLGEDTNGIELLRTLRDPRCPPSTAADQRRPWRRIGAPGAKRRLSLAAATIGHHIQSVLRGEYVSPAGLGTSAEPEADVATLDLAQRMAHLTAQQFRVLGMLCLGRLNKHIAYELEITEATVKAHMTAILRKLGAANRTQAVLLAGRLSLDPLEIQAPPDEIE